MKRIALPILGLIVAFIVLDLWLMARSPLRLGILNLHRFEPIHIIGVIALVLIGFVGVITSK